VLELAFEIAGAKVGRIHWKSKMAGTYCDSRTYFSVGASQQKEKMPPGIWLQPMIEGNDGTLLQHQVVLGLATQKVVVKMEVLGKLKCKT
jgi:hypothetical protein